MICQGRHLQVCRGRGAGGGGGGGGQRAGSLHIISPPSLSMSPYSCLCIHGTCFESCRCIGVIKGIVCRRRNCY
jgi:hypothetical protein